MWDVQFPNLKVNYIIRKDKIQTELAQYLHTCDLSPSISTFQTAINKGNFISWPGIEEVKFKKILGTPEATILGHLGQERSNLQSTKIVDEDESFPEIISNKTRNCVYDITDLPNTNTAYTDQTGKFPCHLSRGHNYIFVCYDYDGNTILTEPIKHREKESIIMAWEKTHARLSKH